MFNSEQQDNIHAKTGVEEEMRADWADGSLIVGLSFHPTWREKTNGEGRLKLYLKKSARKGRSGQKKPESGGKQEKIIKALMVRSPPGLRLRISLRISS